VETLANNPNFIQAGFHIGRFITTVVDTEADRLNTEALWTELESTSTRINVFDKLEQDLKFDVYSPQKSSTSRKVPCSSNLCEFQSACRSASNSCPYSIEYLSDNTSSSGVLVEDVLYMITESAQPKIVAVPITFGYVLCDILQSYVISTC
jgi:hypothetical protein